MFDNVWLIPLFPLLGFLINGLLGKVIRNERVIGGIGSLALFASFVLSCVTLGNLILLPAGDRVHNVTLFTWISAGTFRADAAFLIDPLSCVMLMVVTGVGFLIHIYSIGYMKGEEGFYRFFAYMNLFSFAMLLLVMGNNLLLMFVGWEGVGLCSYLLIGYYFHKKSACDAGKKAFVMNRVGDFGFLLGIFTLYWYLGQSHGIWTIQFTELAGLADILPTGGVVTIITLFFFLGATGKSAQIPLLTWLPDAMEGPTPVSALIHAATMVTAGVYMIARMNFLFVRAPETMLTVALVGGATALFAATIGTAQNDIKRVLAYSTVSQLGYMFLAMGVGAFSAGIFHLVTHAFFKACLFLGSGAVIHSMQHALHHAHSPADPQDMRNMGGLKARMPRTYWTFFIATVAIAGIPPFAGFFSKDEILWQAFANPLHGNLNYLLWGLGALAACLTAFYMFRLLFMTFHGDCRITSEAMEHLQESPKVIVYPLIVLAFMSAIGGFIGMPRVFGAANLFARFLDPVFSFSAEYMKGSQAVEAHSPILEWGLMGASVGMAAIGIAIASTMYIRNKSLPGRFVAAFPLIYRAVFNKWYLDEIYDFLIVNPCKATARFLWKGFDVVVVDGLVDSTATLIMGASRLLKNTQTGYVYNYALSMAIGVVVIFVLYIFR
jgi:NADH-quinone oxidoreductase subunit L